MVQKDAIRTAPVTPNDGRVDSLLVSIAETFEEAAVVVVLLGLGSEGTAGVAATKQFGGFAIAECNDEDLEPAPQAISAAGIADMRLRADRIPAEIAAYVANVIRSEGATVAAAFTDDVNQLIARVAAILRSATGNDFHGYKHATFLRRIQRRMQVVQIDRLDAYIERLRGDPSEVQPPVPGPADRGHPVLPRSLGVRAAGAGRDPQAVRGQVSGRSDPAVGARLRYGGRGLLPRHPAARTDLQDGRGAARTDLRHRHRRARPGDRAQRPLPRHHRPAYVARTPRPLVREGRRHLQHRQGSARDVHLLAAQPDQGRPVFPHRPAVVPQPADLPEQRASGAGDPDLPLLAAARRLPVPGSGGKRHPAPEAVRADRSPQPDFPAAGDAHAGAAGLPSEPADGSSGRRRRGRLPSAATAGADGAGGPARGAGRRALCPGLCGRRRELRRPALLRPNGPLPGTRQRRGHPQLAEPGAPRPAARPAHGAAQGGLPVGPGGSPQREDGQRRLGRRDQPDRRADLQRGRGRGPSGAVPGRRARGAREPGRRSVEVHGRPCPAAGGRSQDHQGSAADHHRGAGKHQRGAEVLQRGIPIDQRRAPVGQRGTGNLQGGIAGGQRGAADGQWRARPPGGRPGPGQFRPEEPAGIHPDRHHLPGQRAGGCAASRRFLPTSST